MNIETATKDQMMTEILFNDELFAFIGGDVVADAMSEEALRAKVKAWILSSPEA